MKKFTSIYKIPGLLGKSGDLDVFMGFAGASTLLECSFADILQEETGLGYQRPYSKRHSQDFKKYISLPNTSTPPLIFNLRDELRNGWRVETESNGYAVLYLNTTSKSMAQVDCQHRLGELHDSDIPLAFMAFIGLNLRDEMAMFNVINGKAKGLSSSLTDYHESRLLDDVVGQAPHLYVARKLNEDPLSPWYQMVRYGGESTSGLKRRTSLRMMQKAVKEFLSKANCKQRFHPEKSYEIIVNYWRAVKKTFPKEWDDHRHHLLSKGIGLYSMMQVLTDCVNAFRKDDYCEDFFINNLSVLAERLDWSSRGAFASANGRKGANEVYREIKKELKF
jgi:DGQHR domain-containing protein